MGIIINAARHRAEVKRNVQITSRQSPLRRIARVTGGFLTRCRSFEGTSVRFQMFTDACRTLYTEGPAGGAAH